LKFFSHSSITDSDINSTLAQLAAKSFVPISYFFSLLILLYFRLRLKSKSGSKKYRLSFSTTRNTISRLARKSWLSLSDKVFSHLEGKKPHCPQPRFLKFFRTYGQNKLFCSVYVRRKTKMLALRSIFK
jgi:hypothetical protein